MLGVLAVVAVAVGVREMWRSLPHHRHAVAAWQGAPEKAGAPVTLSSVPDRYRLTYRVDSGAPLGATSQRLVVSVKRPLESRQVTTPKGSSKVLGDEVSALGRLLVNNPGQPQNVIGLPVDLAAADMRLDVEGDALVSRGLLVRQERRVVLGRPCQVYRSGVPPEGTLVPKPPTDAEHVDTCVDAAGLVLAQVETSGGTIVTRRVATKVELHPTFDAHLFDIGLDTTIPPDQGGGRVAQVPASTLPPGRSWFLDQPPAGFTSVGHFAVAGAVAKDQQGNPLGQRLGGFTDVWVRGADLLLVDQGGTEFGGAPFSPVSIAQPVDLGPLGQGEALVGTRLSVVRVALPGGHYVRVAGTLKVDELAALARTLRPEDHPA